MGDTYNTTNTTFIKVDVSKVKSLGGELISSKTIHSMRNYKEIVLLQFPISVSEEEVRNVLHLPNRRVEMWHDNEMWEFIYSDPYLSLCY